MVVSFVEPTWLRLCCAVRLQSVLEAMAWLIFHMRSSNLITCVLDSLHWLRIQSKVLNGNAPSHLDPFRRSLGSPISQVDGRCVLPLTVNWNYRLSITVNFQLRAGISGTVYLTMWRRRSRCWVLLLNFPFTSVTLLQLFWSGTANWPLQQKYYYYGLPSYPVKEKMETCFLFFQNSQFEFMLLLLLFFQESTCMAYSWTARDGTSGILVSASRCLKCYIQWCQLSMCMPPTARSVGLATPTSVQYIRNLVVPTSPTYFHWFSSLQLIQIIGLCEEWHYFVTPNRTSNCDIWV